jgi:hypothetical protein
VAVQSRPVVVLACAGSDASHFTTVVRALVAKGAKVDLVTGVEAHVRPLEQAVERYGARALYVLCHSQALDRYQGDLLELTVRAGEVGNERLLSTWFDANDTDALTATVMQRLEEIQAPAAAPPPSPRSRSSMLGRLGASASLSIPANTMIAARAALANRNAWRAFALALVLTALVMTAIHFVL